MLQLHAPQAVMTQCEQGKPDNDGNPRVYMSILADGDEFKAVAYGLVEAFKEPPVPLDYTFQISSRTYNNNVNFTIENIHVDDPYKIREYYLKATESQVKK